MNCALWVFSPGDPAGCEEGESAAVQVQSKVFPRGRFRGTHPGDHAETLLPAGKSEQNDNNMSTYSESGAAGFIWTFGLNFLSSCNNMYSPVIISNILHYISQFYSSCEF